MVPDALSPIAPWFSGKWVPLNERKGILEIHYHFPLVAMIMGGVINVITSLSVSTSRIAGVQPGGNLESKASGPLNQTKSLKNFNKIGTQKEQ